MAQGGGKGDDVEITLLLLVAMGFLFLWGLWAYAKQPIVEAIRWMKWTEVAVFQLIDPALAEDRQLLETLVNDQTSVAQMRERLQLQNKEMTVKGWIENKLLAPEVLWTISNRVGHYTRWPVALFLIALAIYYMYFSKRSKMKTKWDLESLIKVQAGDWPVITPIVDFNPTEDNARNPGEPVPLDLPLFAEALSPEEWVAYHQIPVINKMPDKEGMRRALQQQLGPRWTGVGCLTPAQRCLFAAFALKGAQKRKDGDALLGRVAVFWNHKTDFHPPAELMAEVDAVINNPKIGGPALRIADKFAWRTTALSGVLKWARERGGVLAPAAFLWMRGHDRPTWYALNNLGRRTFHAEAAGVMGHYLAERAAGKPLPIPRLETAILTITQYWGINNPTVPPLEEKEKGKGLIKT